jgi:hypothetical protein
MHATLDGDAMLRYDPTSEPLPTIPAYHPSFTKAEELAKGLNRDVQDDHVGRRPG